MLENSGSSSGRKDRIILIAGLSPAVILLLLLIFYPLPKRLDPSWSRIVRFNDGSVMRTYISDDGKWRIFLPLQEIDPLIRQVTVLYEDRFFRFHPGVNPVSLVRAFFQNIKARRIVSGGSTITMQLARIAEPKDRTVLAKLIEIFRALQIEMRFSKRRILELYLNIAPYGGNVEGIAAATLAYYNRLPENMTPEEVAFLVSLPQSPSLRRPQGEPSALEGRNSVLRVMLEHGLVDEVGYKTALASAVPREFRPFPFHAPHAADFLTLEYRDANDINSTIDRNIQKKVENILASYGSAIFYAGASNASVVVIENRTRKVRAAVGSLDYFDAQHAGQVRGFYSYRSPGSALKPFLYVMALEAGLINSEMYIEDAPYKFGDYEPGNYSGLWKGLVRAEEALSQSLNLPFILILKRYGYQRFIQRLQRSGFSGPLDFQDYGLPIIIGGMEVRLLDLTNLYTTLSRGGLHSRWLFLENDTIVREDTLFRPGAVLIAMQALSKRDRPDAPQLSTFTMPRGKICWKTGTSYGRRDAWSVGFQRDYTVGVWVGNFSGEGSDSIVGAVCAAPVMFDIIRALEDQWTGRFSWEEDAAFEVERVDVCAFSGYRPGPNCPEKRTVEVVKNAHPFVECPFHKKYIVEKETGYRANPWKKYQEGALAEKLFIIYPPQVQKVMGGVGKEPPFAPDFSLVDDEGALKITSPLDGAVYLVPLGVRGAGRIPLQGFTSAKEDKIHWFLNDKYKGATHSGEIMEIEPEAAAMKIVAQDVTGASQTIRIAIERE